MGASGRRAQTSLPPSLGAASCAPLTSLPPGSRRRCRRCRRSSARGGLPMAKRRHVTFEEPDWGEEEPRPPRKRVAAGGPGSRFPGQPSLDSDEEEEEEEEEEAEGCPELWGLGAEPDPEGAWSAAEGAGPVPLTPFNLEEELGEGRFDPQGHFLPHPRTQPRDPWSDSLEGVQVKPRPLKDPIPAPAPPPPLHHLLGEVLELLRPGETLGGAMRRLGGRGQERGRRVWPRPRPAPELEELVGLADGLVARGLLGALEETREGLQGRLRALRGDTSGRGDTTSGSPYGTSGAGEGASSPGEGASGGLYGTVGAGEGASGEEEVTSGEGNGTSGEGKGTSGEGEESVSSASGRGIGTSGEEQAASGEVAATSGEAQASFDTARGAQEGLEEEVLWEYRWEGEGPETLYGPFSSRQMQEWASQGYFEGGARCRRVQPPGPFYDCSRVDFELYT